MGERTEIEIWVVLDEDGCYSVGESREAACERHEENIGSAAGARLFKLSCTAQPPAPVEMAVTVPDESGEIVLESGGEVT